MTAENRELCPLNGPPLRKMIDVSTAHMPDPDPYWDEVRAAEHEEGWVVFINPGLEEVWVPEWLRPLWRTAVQCDCILINFDKDGDVYEELWPTWEW